MVESARRLPVPRRRRPPPAATPAEGASAEEAAHTGERRPPLRVAIADDNRLIVAGIIRALEQDEEIEIVGEAYSGIDVLPLVERMQPDVLLLDLRMPGVGGVECLDRVRELHREVKVVILAADSDWDHIQTALTHGAAGYIVTTINPRDLAAALRQAGEHNVYHALPRPQALAGEHGRQGGLTEREVTILKGVARGLSNQAIARELWVTEQTVKFHLTNIFRKLGVTNRTEAARYAFLHHIVDPDDDTSN